MKKKEKEDFENQKLLVSVGMELEGGSFVKSLGNALGFADSINSIKIKNAFPEYWEKYLKIGEKFVNKV